MAGFVAHDAFRIVLGAEVGVIQPLGLLEHVFAEHALVQAGGGDRAEQVEMLGADGLGKAHRLTRALHVDLELSFGVGAQVVDGRHVKEMCGLLAQLAPVGRRHAQHVLRQVAHHRGGPGVVAAPEVVQRLQALGVALAHQKEDARAFALQQSGHQPLADETGGPGDEVLHVCLLRGSDAQGGNSRSAGGVGSAPQARSRIVCLL